MSAYLKRLQIDSVEEVGVDTTATAYLKRVEIVEVVDSDGNPWAPVPGPDPWDELVVVQEATWSETNVYAVGETISGTSATFTGGTGNETYRSRVQYHSATEGGWTNTPWTEHLNVPKVISGVVPPGYEGGEVRFKTQAIDLSLEPLAPVNSIAPIQTIAYSPLVVSATTVSGLPYVGETVTCAQPTVTGGQEPYAYNYMWLDQEAAALSPSNTTTLGMYDLGKMVSCYVGVSSADGQSANTTTPTIGPVEQYTIGTLVPIYDGETYDPNDPPTITEDASFVIWVTQDGTSPNIVYEWEVRGGQARLTPNGATCTVINQSAAPGQLAVQVNARDAFADPTGESFRFQFAVITN